MHSTSIRPHSKNDEKNRHVLGQSIDVLKFVGCHELPFRGHDEMASSSNRGLSFDVVEYTLSIKSNIFLYPLSEEYMKKNGIRYKGRTRLWTAEQSR